MAIKRCEQIDSNNAGYYHLISRCVRRAYLCGEDKDTGQNYEHRREWIEKRILHLAKIFSVQVYSYAVMPNHYHLVVYSDPLAPQGWSDSDIAERWLTLFPGTQLQKDSASIRRLKHEVIVNDAKLLEIYRKRLGSISWMMKCLNEPIAKKCNREDCMRGHFWESRFRSQALLDETAAITCMAYVDLNPIRAGHTQKLEESQYTSIQGRIKQMSKFDLDKATKAIAGSLKSNVLSIDLRSYIELLEWTGKHIVHPKKASIPKHLSSIFFRLKLDQNNWLGQINNYDRIYFRAVGSSLAAHKFTQNLDLYWIKGQNALKDLYLST